MHITHPEQTALYVGKGYYTTPPLPPPPLWPLPSPARVA